jgi:hypothetical protein
MRHGGPDSNGTQHRPYVSTLAYLTFLQAAAASVSVCEALGVRFVDDLGRRVRTASADLGVLALKFMGVGIDTDGAAFIAPDSLLARIAGLTDHARLLQQRVTEQQTELTVQMRWNQGLAVQLSRLQDGMRQQTAHTQEQIMALRQREAQINAMLASERARHARELQELTTRVNELLSINRDAADDMAKMDVTLEALRDRSEGHRLGKKNANRELSRAQEANEALNQYYQLMSTDTSKRFVQLLHDNPPPPDSQRHLLKLIENQMSCYANPKHRCNLWHKDVLAWCAPPWLLAWSSRCKCSECRPMAGCVCVSQKPPSLRPAVARVAGSRPTGRLRACGCLPCGNSQTTPRSQPIERAPACRCP